MSLTQFCFSVRQAEAGLRSSQEMVAVGSRPASADRYDGMDILRENVRVGGITTTSYYVHGPSIDEPLAKETAGLITYYHADGLGSIVKETSAAGAVTASLRYDAWGNIEAGARDGFAFTGREWDPETGLYYYRARYCDPNAGRFISEDPIGFGDGPNRYLYAQANPQRFTDPSGLWSKEQCAAAKRVLELEARLGTRRAAAHASVTFGDKILEPFNSSHSPQQDIPTPYGPIQLDWFADISTFNPASGVAFLTYTFGKIYWDISRLAKGAPIGNAMPLADAGERNAVGAIMMGKGFKDILTDWTLAEECSCSAK